MKAPNDPYRSQSPEAVLNTLEASYARREIDRYEPLLVPEFRFHFPHGCSVRIGGRVLDPGRRPARDRRPVQDDRGNVRSPSTSDLQPSEPAGDGWPAGARHIRATATRLAVEETNGITLLVQGDTEDFYFRKGLTETAEDTTRWYLLEWFDRGGSSGSAAGLLTSAGLAAGRANAAPNSPLVQPTTWGLIKALFS